MPSWEPSLIDLLKAQGIDVATVFGFASADQLRHLCDSTLAPVFLPYGWIDIYPAHNPASSPEVVIRTDDCAGIAAHPSNPEQLIMASISIVGEEPVGAKQWVSIAHLAHRDCAACAHVWVRRAEEYAVAAQKAHAYAPDTEDRWSLFVRQPTEDDQAVVLMHIGDSSSPS